MRRFGGGDLDARAEVRGPRELREMSARFNEMAQALADQRKSQLAFLGGVAHDMRNPLHVLKLALATVPPGRPLPSEPRLRTLFERLSRHIGRLERMSNDFVDMAKIESGKLELRLEDQDARALVQEVVELFEGTAPEHELRVILPGEAVPVRCDPLRLEQVLTNLVSNAIKYSPGGGRIELGVERVDGEAVIRVTDHGVGIAASDQSRLFEPFRRAGLSQGTVPGAGLGLAVVRRIVDAHGGHIDVDSQPGRGSTFSVHLPVPS
jgi:signal transduction histidine kinase